MRLRLLLKRRTPARRMKGNASWRKLAARLLELGSASVRMFWAIPIATPATKATGMLLRLAMAAAVMPATSRVVKLRVFVGSRGFWMGRSRTPERPARTLESAHAPAATPDAFTPSSWESRLDSTTARIFRPTDVHLKTAIKVKTITTVKTVFVICQPFIGLPAAWKKTVLGLSQRKPTS